MKKKNKYYVVWNGHQPGIYHSWEECQLQVKAFPNAKYKSFDSKTEAMEAFHQGYTQPVNLKKKSSNANWNAVLPEECVVVDAACSGNPGLLEYQGVNPHTGEKLFHVGPLKKGTNNLGEFLAIVHALAWLKNSGKFYVSIYSDSKIAIKWVKTKHPATKLAFDSENAPLKQLIQRAVDWLYQNKYENPVVKWETEDWGENPADFGRK